RLARFTIERVERPRNERNTAPEGQIIEQTPRAATRVAPGSTIVLTVSSAPRALIEIFEMPNVVGRSYADASRALAEFKVTRTETAGKAPRDQVLSQIPAAGSTLQPGDAVTLQVSAGAANAQAVATPEADAKIAANAAASSASDPSEPGSWRAALAIGAAVLLGVIAGALVMRQWLIRQRSDAVADDAIASLSPSISSVDILLEESVPQYVKDEPSQETDSEPEQVEEAESSPRKEPEHNDKSS
ncbi:MAG: PASTA domain-containing protein, partial [Burkholderiaceae bacterium]